MKRTQIYISEKMQEDLDALSQRRGVSKSEIIREAVTEYLTDQSKAKKREKLRAGEGLWKERKDLPDLSELRREFDRLN